MNYSSLFYLFYKKDRGFLMTMGYFFPLSKKVNSKIRTAHTFLNLSKEINHT